MFRMKVSASISISIHAPPRGATSQKNAKKGFTRFQFTPLREGRRAQYWFPVPEVFQFTPLREGRHVPVGLRLTARIFQFTPLREGRPNRQV